MYTHTQYHIHILVSVVMHTLIHNTCALRTVTEVTAPAALSSVALLKDGFTLIGGGADGERERERGRGGGGGIQYSTAVHCWNVISCLCHSGKLYVYELRSVKTPREVIEAHQSAVTCIAPQHSAKVRKPVNISSQNVSENKVWKS